MNASLFAVRSARAEDAPALAALEQLCVNESESYRGSTHLLSAVPLIGHELANYQSDPQHIVLVIESSNEICGFALGQRLERHAETQNGEQSIEHRPSFAAGWRRFVYEYQFLFSSKYRNSRG